MFRRTKSSPGTDQGGAAAAAPEDPTTHGRLAGKGRPTPSRREAEAAARARAKAALDPRATKKQQRAHRAERSRAARQGLKDGDQRYLPARDQGPVKAFVRDFVDSRLNMAEFALPLLFASLLLSQAGSAQLGAAVTNALVVIVLFDSLFLRRRMRRELKLRFPGDPLKGTTFYAYMRSLQLRFLRLPKPRVKLGQALPKHY